MIEIDRGERSWWTRLARWVVLFVAFSLSIPCLLHLYQICPPLLFNFPFFFLVFLIIFQFYYIHAHTHTHTHTLYPSTISPASLYLKSSSMTLWIMKGLTSLNPNLTYLGKPNRNPILISESHQSLTQ